MKITPKIVCYDLCMPGRDYSVIHEYLKQYPLYLQVNQSVWIILTDKNCKDVVVEMQRLADSNDKFFAAELSGIMYGKLINDSENYFHTINTD